MSKRKAADDAARGLFAKTAPTDQGPQAQGPIDKTVSIGIGLKQSELDELQQRADGMGISRNALIVYLVRHGLADLRDGTLKIEFETVRRPKPPA